MIQPDYPVSGLYFHSDLGRGWTHPGGHLSGAGERGQPQGECCPEGQRPVYAQGVSGAGGLYAGAGCDLSLSGTGSVWLVGDCPAGGDHRHGRAGRVPLRQHQPDFAGRPSGVLCLHDAPDRQ